MDRIFEKLVADTRARRELLWLRAKEKGDEGAAADLERMDPEIISRLREAGLDLDGSPNERREARRERFGRLSDERFEHHVAIIASEMGYDRHEEREDA
jgi:hypothetical protein